MIKSYKK